MQAYVCGHKKIMACTITSGASAEGMRFTINQINPAVLLCEHEELLSVLLQMPDRLEKFLLDNSTVLSPDFSFIEPSEANIQC